MNEMQRKLLSHAVCEFWAVTCQSAGQEQAMFLQEISSEATGLERQLG